MILLQQLFLLLGITTLPIANAANILIMQPWPWYSHTNNYMPIFKGLAARGHNITMVSPFPQKTPIPNFNDIVFPDLKKELLDAVPSQNLVKSDGLWFRMFGMWTLGINWMKITLEQDLMKQLIADTNNKYDLVIIETWFIQELFVAFGHKYNAPVVNLAARFISAQAAHLTGNQLPVSYVPDVKLPHSDRMNFLERVNNLFHYYWEVIAGEFYYIRQQEALMRKYFNYPGSETLPPLMDMLRNTSLTLMDSSFSIGYPTPLHKNIVEFGGINIKKAAKLPPDLQKYMDSAKDGVVYFSFGSYVEVSLIDPIVQQAIISGLGKLKQKVIMKLEATNPYINTTKPNIMVRQWLPQSSILAHPNCKAFITHAGLHSVMEGVYYKVPMVALPLFVDQKINAKFSESAGIGYLLDINELTADELVHAVNTVITTDSYKENLKRRSEIFTDKPMSTLDNTIYWIEYVIRHKGAPHLRPAVLDLHWYQYLMLDVIAFYLLIVFIILYVIKLLLSTLWSIVKWMIFREKDEEKLKKSKRKPKKE